MGTFSVVRITPEQLRLWGIRGGFSILDQGLISGATFVLSLLLARWLTPDAYGAFAVAFATFLCLAAYHTVLLLEPMTVMGPAKYTERMVGYFIAQLKVHGLVVTSLSGLMVLVAGGLSLLGVERVLVLAILGSAVALPFLLLLWLVRRMCYVVQQPSIALRASFVYVVLMLAGLLALRFENMLSPAFAFIWIGISSIAAVLWPLREIGILKPGILAPCPLMPVVRESWNYGRWLVASTTLLSVASQIQTYLAAGMIGLSAAGALRAMQIPSLVMVQVVTAVSLLALPSMASDFGRGRMDMLRRKAAFSTLVLTAMAATYFIVLWVFAGRIEHILYGGKFSANVWLIPVLGLVPVCTAFLSGFSMVLRAAQKPHYDLVGNAIAAPVALVSALVFIKVWGLRGAATSLVAGYAVVAIVLLFSYRKLMRKIERASGILADPGHPEAVFSRAPGRA